MKIRRLLRPRDIFRFDGVVECGSKAVVQLHRTEDGKCEIITILTPRGGPIGISFQFPSIRLDDLRDQDPEE